MIVPLRRKVGTGFRSEENIRTRSSELSGFAICSFEKTGILVVPTTDNPYLASKVLSTPVKMVSRLSLVFLGIVFLAIAKSWVLWTLVRMALAGSRIAVHAAKRTSK